MWAHFFLGRAFIPSKKWHPGPFLAPKDHHATELLRMNEVKPRTGQGKELESMGIG